MVGFGKQVFQFSHALLEHMPIEERFTARFSRQSQNGVDPVLTGFFSHGFDAPSFGVIRHFISTQIEKITDHIPRLRCLSFCDELGYKIWVVNQL